MAQHDYDLFVIGAGSGGVRAARLAAKAGARVAIAEDDRIGGTCVIRGCVPKKLLVYGSDFAQGFKDAKNFGWDVAAPDFNWRRLADNVEAEVSRLSGIYRKNLEAAGVAILEDRAEIVDAHAIKLKHGGSFSAGRILIATGGHTYRPTHLPGFELGVTSSDAFKLEELPRDLLILGGGYIALEFAAIFHGLGVKVSVGYRGRRVLRGFDNDVRKHVEAEMNAAGVRIINETHLKSLTKLANGRICASMESGVQLEFDAVMFALGRAPNTLGLGLENAGVKLNGRGAVMVDEYSRSNVASIWAVGDVTDRLNLTPVAIREAQAFADTEFRGRPTAFDHADVASAVFCRPPVGAVGLTEADAHAQFRNVQVFRTIFRPMKHILAGNPQQMMMKLVVDADTDRVVGVHIAGPDAPEMIQVAAIAVKARLTKAQWDATCAVHPTAAEELVLMSDPVAHDNEAPA